MNLLNILFNLLNKEVVTTAVSNGDVNNITFEPQRFLDMLS